MSLKPWPLKLWLVLLVAAVVVPLSTLTGFVVWQARDVARARAEDGLLHRARASASVVDAAFQGVETGLRGLAASASLARGDVDAVEVEMRSMARQIGGAPIGLATADGRELLSTTWMPGERRTGAALGPGLAALVASRRTEFDNLSPLPASGQPAVAVVVPVEGPHAGRGLSFHATLPAARLSALLAAAGANNGGATVRVLDRVGAAAAGMRGESGLIGLPLLPSLLGAWRDAVPRVVLPAGDDDGDGSDGAAAESLAFARAPRSGYTVVIGVPQAVLAAPLGNAVLKVVALSGAFLFVGGFLAVVLARRFGRELRQATRAEPRLAASLLREADELARSVAEAAAARDRATAGLAASEQRFRALAETGALVVWRSDAEGAPLESRGWRALTGQSREEVDGKGWLAAVHPEDRAAAAAAWTGARAAGRPAATEFRVRSGAESGGWRWVRARGVPVARRAGGRIAEWIGVMEDVHGRREAEKAPAGGREGRLRLALEAANIATWEYDLARNEGARLGWPGEGILFPGGEGLPLEGWLEQVHPEDRATLQAAFLGMEDGSQTRFVAEFRVRRRAPAEGWAWVSSAGAVVERDPATGAPLRIAGVSSDITERREAEARRLLVAREVDHRAKNLLAVVQSVLRVTPRDEPEEFAVSVERRIAALARAHSLLAERGWSAAGLDAVAAREFASLPPGAAEMEGPPAALVGSAVQPVAMALHELATNSTKHGALSRPEGRVALRWELDRSTGTLRLFWTESGGPPVSAPPSRRGFGSRMIEATVQGQLGGSLAFDWQEDGLRVEIALPAARVLAAGTEPETEKVQFAFAAAGQ